MSELEPLPDDLRSLFEAEGASYPDDAALRARVLRGIETSVAFAALAQVGATSAASSAASTGAAVSAATKTAIVVGLLSFGVGVGVGEWHGRSSTEVQSPPSLVDVRTPPTAATAAPTTLASAPDADSVDFHALPLAPTATAAAAPATTGSNGASPPVGDVLAQEQALVDTARAALARGRAVDALRAADEHAARFPAGKLAEERENLAIQALAFAGRRDEAQARAARFHKRYPGSLYGGALDELLKAPPRDGSP